MYPAAAGKPTDDDKTKKITAGLCPEPDPLFCDGRNGDILRSCGFNICPLPKLMERRQQTSGHDAVWGIHPPSRESGLLFI